MITWDELAAVVERKWYDTEVNRDERVLYLSSLW